MSSRAVRLIPILLVLDGRIVKTRRFSQPTYVGDPLNTVLMFSELEVDELFLLDIGASAQNRGPNLEFVETIARYAHMPLCYGGGISTVSDAAKLFALGVEKIAINSVLERDLGLVESLALEFGSQAVVGSIDVRSDGVQPPRVYYQKHQTYREESPLEYAKKLENVGVGELLVTSVDREGTWTGPDIRTVAEIAEAVGIPVVLNGGVGNKKDVTKVIEGSGVTGIGVGSLFEFQASGKGVLVGVPDDLLDFRQGSSRVSG